MARQQRVLGSSGFCHLFFRGVNHCLLFEEEEDYAMFMDCLIDAKNDRGLSVLAFCLMGNHVHLLLWAADTESLSHAMRQMLSRYASWFNWKYQRSGSLIAGRYKSKPVEKDDYLLELVRYIHLNPVEIGLPIRSKFSSYRDYLGHPAKVTETDLVLSMLSSLPENSQQAFVNFHGEVGSMVPVILADNVQIDALLIQETKKLLAGEEPHTLANTPKKERDVILSQLIDRGFSIRKIERVTGVSRGIIYRAKAKRCNET